ncbi:hypothetical protein Tco_0025025 [Tanacetum coccineum]
MLLAASVTTAIRRMVLLLLYHEKIQDAAVFSTDDLGLDWISAHNFLTCLQKLSSSTSGLLEVSELAACLEKLHFLALLVMLKFLESASHLSSLKFPYPNTSALI